MEHAVLLGRDSWTHFSDRSYRTLAPGPGDNRVSGDTTLSHTKKHGLAVVVSYTLDPAGRLRFHLLYADDADISPSQDHQLVVVGLVQSRGVPVLADHSYLVDMLHVTIEFPADEYAVENYRRFIPLAVTAELEPRFFVLRFLQPSA